MIKHALHTSDLHLRRGKMIIPYLMTGMIIVIGCLFLFNSPAEATNGRQFGMARSVRLTMEGRAFQNAPTAVEPIYLPMVIKRQYPQMPSGEVQVSTGPYSCGTNQNCYDLNVVCPQILDPMKAILRIGEPTSLPMTGTILFFTGYTGSYFWGSSLPTQLDGQPEDNWSVLRTASNNSDILDHLRSDGFRTVEVRWPGDGEHWFFARPGNIEGIQKLACRPAEVIRWIYQNLHDESLPYCAEGHSNGASQLTYSMSRYGLSNLFDAVVLESGPNWSRLDQACLWDDPAFSSVWADDGGRNTIDFSYGRGYTLGVGPCYKKDTAYRQQFLDDSLIIGNWQYSFPTTTISFVFGGLDTTTTKSQALLFYNHLLSAGSPIVSSQTIPTAGHFVTDDPQGAQVIENTLRNTCVIP